MPPDGTAALPETSVRAANPYPQCRNGFRGLVHDKETVAGAETFASHAGQFHQTHLMAKSAPLRVSQQRNAPASEKMLRVRLRALEIPPIKDGLVIGRDAAIGGEAMLRTLRLMTNEKFERIQINDSMIEDIIVRAAVLRKLGRDRLLEFILKRVKPVMAETELLMLDIEVEVLIEHTL